MTVRCKRMGKRGSLGRYCDVLARGEVGEKRQDQGRENEVNWVPALFQVMCQVWYLCGLICNLCYRYHHPHFYELRKWRHKSSNKLPSFAHLSST